MIPELQRLAVGDVIPDGPPESGCEFVVADLEPDVHLVLHSTTHLPLTLADPARGVGRLELGLRPAARSTTDGGPGSTSGGARGRPRGGCAP